MADDDLGKDSPSLEPPSLGFGRKRRQKAPKLAPEPESTSPEPAGEDAPTTIFEADDGEPTAVLDKPVARTRAMVPPAEPAPPLFADEVAATAPEYAEDPVQETWDEAALEKAAPAPVVVGMAAAVLTGLLIGVFTVGLTSASLQLCEYLKGTPSCGNPGFLLLVAILIVMVLVGALLLRVCRVPDPGSTSLLAVGLLAVLALIFLVDVLFAWWMIIVIPIFSALAFALSHWVTTAFVEPAEH